MMSFCVLGWAGGDTGFSWGGFSSERFLGMSRSSRLYVLLGTGESATKGFDVDMLGGGRFPIALAFCTAFL